MLEGSIKVELATTGPAAALLLLRERAAWWPRLRTLFVADVHIGKAAAFRAWGAPVPEEATTRDLARLSALAAALRPLRLIVLGDLLHAPAGMTAETLHALSQWRSALGDLPVLLVRGNHDQKIAAGSLAHLGVEEIDPGQMLEGVRLLHDPAEHQQGEPALAGHLHPGVVMRPAAAGKGAGLRAPCFWLHQSARPQRNVPPSQLLVLPAFGTFTGLLPVRAATGDRVFAVGPRCVLEVATDATPQRPTVVHRRRKSGPVKGS